MKNVLVFPCGSEIGLEIYRSLSFSTHFKLLGASSVSDHGQYVYDSYIPDLPFIDDDNFIEAITEVVNKYKIDFIFPAHDSAVLKLSQNQHLVPATIVTSPPETCKIARSKKLTYRHLADTVRVPKIFNQTDHLTYPVFLKPDVGQGSKGAMKVSSKKMVEAAIERDPTLLILEYLPGEEYTVDCFTDREGKLLIAQARTRSRTVNGISVRSKTVDDDLFIEMANSINNKIKFRGVWFFQVKRDTFGRLALMEIAPRVAGTMSVTRMRGANLPLMSLFDQMDIDVAVATNHFIVEVDRALKSKFMIKLNFKTVYVDFDDTLIHNDQINELLIALLYKLRNQGKKLILVTKHKHNITQSIEDHLIHSRLFEEIISLPKTEKKKLHVGKDSIFIDDSFAERQAILDHVGIPVFDVSEAVELL